MIKKLRYMLLLACFGILYEGKPCYGNEAMQEFSIEEGIPLPFPNDSLTDSIPIPLPIEDPSIVEFYDA